MEVSQNQKSALDFWRNCSNTYLAAEEYYIKQEMALRKLLKHIGYIKRALDIGCGDGRFTFIVKAHSIRVTGIDISPKLIQKALSQIENEIDRENIQFNVDSIETFTTDLRYQLITCMGVTSGLIDNSIFDETIIKIGQLMTRKSWLIVKDTLSLKEDKINKVNNYVAIYRNINSYKNFFYKHGFLIEKEIELMKANNDTVNIMILMQLRR